MLTLKSLATEWIQFIRNVFHVVRAKELCMCAKEIVRGLVAAAGKKRVERRPNGSTIRGGLATHEGSVLKGAGE